jgi:hypothetical protein
MLNKPRALNPASEKDDYFFPRYRSIQISGSSCALLPVPTYLIRDKKPFYNETGARQKGTVARDTIMTGNDTPQDTGSDSSLKDADGDTSPCAPPISNTLERIVDQTDEMAHLNELVLLHLEKRGGFTTPEAYFTLVQPVLDLLEVEIRVRYYPGMTATEMKLVVQDWIDCEIAELRKSR